MEGKCPERAPVKCAVGKLCKAGEYYARFQDSLKQNITLARSIEQQFIIGSNYNFNYNTQAQPNRKRNNFYFNGNLDLSGNLLGLATGANAQAGRRKEVFGSRFSQYIRGEVKEGITSG